MNKDTFVLKIAEGVYSSAKESNQVALFQEELRFFVWNLKLNNDLYYYLCSPFVEDKDKLKTIEETFKNVFSNEFLAFIQIVINKKVMTEIKDIRKIFDTFADQDANQIRGKIFSSFNLDLEQVKKIENAFSKKLNRRVILETKNDPSLIAGLKVLIGDKVYEYSIDSQLESIKDKLIKNL